MPKEEQSRDRPPTFEADEGRLEGRFREMEAQPGGLTAGGIMSGGGSIDWAEATVWALTQLMLKVRAQPQVRRV